MKMVRVKWIDSGLVGRWIDREDTCDILACESIGYLVEKTPRRVVLAQSLNEHQYGNLLAIPRGAITKIERVR